jgi:hypothetical protein
MDEIHVPRVDPTFEVLPETGVERVARSVIEREGRHAGFFREGAMDGRIPEHGDADAEPVASELLRIVGDRLLEATPGTRKAEEQRLQSRSERGDLLIERFF